MSGEAPTSPAERQPGRRQMLADPAVLTIAMYTVVAIAAAIAAYFILFTQFAPYDDEGTLLVTLKAFAHGDALYSDIYSPYGPFYHELFGGLVALTGLDVTNDASRSAVLVIWVGTSLMAGLAAQRLTGVALLGATGMMAAFAALQVLANEPMHPQGLCVLLIAAFFLLVVGEPARRLRWAGAGAGVLLAALVLTKVNLGAFALAAVALAAVLTVEPLYRRRWLRWPVVAGFLLLPVLIVARDLDLEWARNLAALEILSGLALIVAARAIRPAPGEDAASVVRWLIAAAIGFASASAVILLAIVLNGSAPADIYDGVVTQAIRVRDVMSIPFPMPAAALDWGIAAVGVATLAVLLRPTGSGSPSIYPGLLRAAAGLAIWYTAAHVTPFSLGPAAGNPNSLPLVLCWVAAIPPVGVHETPYKRFLRVLLPAFAVAETLQVYPVAGSQAGIAAFTLIPVGALCLADAVTSLRAWSEARGGSTPQRFGTVLLVLTATLAVQFGIDTIARPGASRAVLYHEQQSLPLPGAHLLRLPPAEVETYSGLVDLLHRYRCSSFIAYPNIDSLYLWSGIEAPPPQAPGAWITALGGERQQRIVDELRASPRPCAIRSDTRADLWLHGSPPPDEPLVHYILDDFHSVQQVGEFEFLQPNDTAESGG